MLIVVVSKRAIIRVTDVQSINIYKCTTSINIYARRANLSRPDLSKCECTFPCFWLSLHDQTSSSSRENCQKYATEYSTGTSHAIDKKTQKVVLFYTSADRLFIKNIYLSISYIARVKH